MLQVFFSWRIWRNSSQEKLSLFKTRTYLQTVNISSAQIIATEFLEALGTVRKQYNKLHVLSTFDIWWQTKKN